MLTQGRPRVFVGEFLTGGGLRRLPASRFPEGKLAEGIAMWRALVDDFGEFADVVTPVDPRLTLPTVGQSDAATSRHVQCVAVDPHGNHWPSWTQLARDTDLTIIVAPETDGSLAQGVSILRGAGIPVLAPGCETLRITSDKRQTARWAATAGIPHPKTHTYDEVHSRRASDSPGLWVVKPIDGCGTNGVRLFHQRSAAVADMAENELLQIFWPGRPASMLVLADPGTGLETCLPGVWQSIAGLPNTREPSMDRECIHLAYVGGQGPVDSESQRRLQSLARRALEALPGPVAGFIGIDAILGDDANHDALIEINPRLTTSYIGIRRMVRENLCRRFVSGINTPVTPTVPPATITWDVHP